LRAARAALADVLSGARERMLRIDLLQYQVDEIGRANLQIGEEEALTAERSRLVNAERLAVAAAVAYEALVGTEDVADRGAALNSLQQAARTLRDLTGIDPATVPIAEKIDELLYTLEDVVADVRAYRDAVEADPARLTVVEERLAGIRQLTRKYGTDIAAVLDHARSAAEELERLTGSATDAESLSARADALAREVGALAEDLSRKRAIAAVSLAADVEASIAQLHMGNAAFEVALERVEDPGGVPIASDDGSIATYAVEASGIDRVTFLIAPNAGEGLKPLNRIASGGETARLMLALKSILSHADQTPTLVFDEIDVGVGGRSGQAVGEKLRGLAETHQVITITHLPQIASLAEAHFQIAKDEVAGRVVSTVTELEGDDRTYELAAMLDGLPVSKSSLKTAEEMLRRSAARHAATS
jgi:DNA repair protein RecN (Recombination protein N)